MKSRFLIICLLLLSINYAAASNPPSEWIHGDTLILPETKTSLGISEYQGLSEKIRVIVFGENFTSFGMSCLQGGHFTTFVFKSTTPPSIGVAMEMADTIKCPCSAFESYYNSGWRRSGSNTGRSYELLRDLPFTLSTTENEQGYVKKEYPCDGTIIITPVSKYGYHFTQWSDGVTDNPRTVVMTKDTTFIALFAHNPVVTYVCNSQMGRITGPSMTTTGVAAENITFEAIPNYGYHFTQWSDGNTDNPRTIWLSQDTTFTAEFAKNTYTISTTSANPEWGATDGDTTALYLDTVSISAIPNYGYHFVKWDGYDVIDNSITVATAISIASELPTNSESDIYTIVGYVVGKYNYYDNLLYKIADTPNGGNTFLIYTGSQSVSIGDYISITGGHIYKSSDLQYASGYPQQMSFIKITNNLYNVVVKILVMR